MTQVHAFGFTELERPKQTFHRQRVLSHVRGNLIPGQELRETEIYHPDGVMLVYEAALPEFLNLLKMQGVESDPDNVLVLRGGETVEERRRFSIAWNAIEIGGSIAAVAQGQKVGL